MKSFIRNIFDALSHVEVRNIATGVAIGSPLVMALAFVLS